MSPMSRSVACRISFAVCLVVSGLSAASLAQAGTASGTIGRGKTTLKVVDAVAWKGAGYFSEEPVIKLALAGSAFDAKALAAAIDIEREVERQLEGMGDAATLELEPSGGWRGAGSYSFRENGCGFCQNSVQTAQLKVEAGVLKGTLKARAADTEDGDGTEANLTLNVPILEPTGITKLQADGGEPGKALKACQQTLKGSDKGAFVAACFAADDPDIANKNLDYFETVAALADAVSYGRRGMLLEGLKISGGRLKGDQAELTVEGKQVYRTEGQPDSVENYKGRVFLARGPNGWRFSGDALEQVH